jgi:hypothetical protein
MHLVGFEPSDSPSTSFLWVKELLFELEHFGSLVHIVEGDHSYMTCESMKLTKSIFLFIPRYFNF